jgi:restriction endonuclease Mrr
MSKSVLWIDDSEAERASAHRMLSGIDGIHLAIASSSKDARVILKASHVDCVVTDILRRNPDRTVSRDDGYEFFKDYIRPNWPILPVIFHTKNLPDTFEIDHHSQYLSKWESEEFKAIELEVRLNELVRLYDAFADSLAWSKIESRLVEVRSTILDSLGDPSDIWRMSPTQFEQLIAELLDKIGFKVFWVPGGSDQGIDIVAASPSSDYLIDVKRYSPNNPVSVELVRHVYGVASAVQEYRHGRVVRGGIITSSRFTSGVKEFRKSVRVRPLLRDGEWLRAELRKYTLLRQSGD